MVWSQQRSGFQPDGTFGLSRDLGRLLGLDSTHPAAATNVLLIKASYWLDL